MLAQPIANGVEYERNFFAVLFHQLLFAFASKREQKRIVCTLLAILVVIVQGINEINPLAKIIKQLLRVLG